MAYEFNPGPLPLRLPLNSPQPLCPLFSPDCYIWGCTQCSLVWEPLHYPYDSGLWSLQLAAGVGVPLLSNSLVVLTALKCSMGQMPRIHGNHSGCCPSKEPWTGCLWPQETIPRYSVYPGLLLYPNAPRIPSLSLCSPLGLPEIFLPFCAHSYILSGLQSSAQAALPGQAMSDQRVP